MEALRVSNLVKRFEGVVAVNNVSFSVEKGEVVGIIGPNGSGKTTLLNLISGLIKPDEGEVYIKGEAVDPKPHEIALKGVGRTNLESWCYYVCSSSFFKHYISYSDFKATKSTICF